MKIRPTRCRLVHCAVVAVWLAACGSSSGSSVDAGVDADTEAECARKGLPPTTVSGKVYAPNGTLPLYGVNVYVPASAPGPLADGPQCDRCAAGLPGGAVVQTVTDEAGNFTLTGVPATADVPLVIQVGKWRRQLVLPNVAACQDLALPAVDTHLPSKRSQGDMPKIAVSTGAADALECLIRRLGVDDTEITTSTQSGKVHLYSNTALGTTGGQGTNLFQTGYPGGSGSFTDSQGLWNSVDNLKQYDIVMFSCEAGQYLNTKSQIAMNALKAYADFGGRAFLSHGHNIWIEGDTVPGGTGQGVPAWQSIAQWDDFQQQFPVGNDTIDEVNNPKGASFATWMLNVAGSTTRGLVPVIGGEQTAIGVDSTKAERWLYWQTGNRQLPQTFQFTTPNEGPVGQRCGKVVFSDMHVASASTSAAGGAGYPSLCSVQPLTPQEKALIFMFFDISSCVATIL